MFYSCDLLLLLVLLIFYAVIFEAKNADQRGPYLYPLHFERQKSAYFTPQLGDVETLNSCSLKWGRKLKN